MKYQEALKGLHEKQKELKLIVDEFEQLTLKLDDTNKHKDNLENDIEDCKNKLDRAETLLSSLSGEQDRW
jgi:dynein heavy chain